MRAPEAALVKSHQLLAFLEAPQRRGKRPAIHRLRRYVEEMREQAADLAIEHTNELTAPGHLDTKELLHCEAEGMFLIHRRDVIEPVEIG